MKSFRYHFLLTPAVLTAFLVCMSSMAHAQDREVSSVSIVEVEASADRGAVTLRHFDPDGEPVLPTAAPGGYVFGTNGYGDLAIAVAFEPPAGPELQIIEVNAYMTRGGAAVLGSYDVGVWAGTSDVGPAAPIYMEAFPIDHIEIVDGAPPIPITVHELGAAVPAAAPFFVGFQWDPDHGADDLGMVSSGLLDDPSPYEWVLEGNMQWGNVAAVWGSNGWHVWVEVVLQEPLSNEPGAEPRTFTLSSVYPNPVAGVSHIDLDVEVSQQVSIEVFNLLGQRVATAYSGSVPAGKSIVPVDASGLTSGLYIVRVQGEDFSQSRRFVVSQ